jgi:hypothetical protein
MIRSLRGRAHHSAFRGLTIAVAVLLFCGQLSSWVHLALVPHAICAEHGELIHVVQAPAFDGTPAPKAGESSLVASAPVEVEHAHDHCQFGPHHRAPAMTAPRAPVVAENRVVPPRPPILGASAPAVRAISLYLLAPKTSPPV